MLDVLKKSIAVFSIIIVTILLLNNNNDDGITDETKKINKEKDMCYTIAYARTKKALKFPSTFDVDGIVNKYEGNGIYFSELKFTAKNSFGFEVPQVALYKCDFPNDIITRVSLKNR